MTDEIRSFFDYFRKVSEFYKRQLTPTYHFPPAYELVAAKLACCALLDALSDGVVSDKQVGERFQSFVKRFSRFSSWDRVSIPQLLYSLQQSPDHDEKYLKLKKYAENCLSRKTEYSIEKDPRKDGLVDKFPDHYKIIDKLTHLSLFWEYRCTLAHEMKQPGYGYETKWTQEPSYHTQIETGTGRLTFQLTYPLPFFFKVCDECIENTEQYHLEEKIQPSVSYAKRSGDAWIELKKSLKG